MSSHVNANNSPLRSVHTKDSSIANRSHGTLQWDKRSWICSGDRNTSGVAFGFGEYRFVKWVAIHIFPQDCLLKSAMHQLVYAFQCTGRDRLPLIFVVWSAISRLLLKFHVKSRYQSWCQLIQANVTPKGGIYIPRTNPLGGCVQRKPTFFPSTHTHTLIMSPPSRCVWPLCFFSCLCCSTFSFL